VALGLVAGLLAALLFGVAAVGQAHAARRMPAIGSLPSFLARAIRDLWMIGVAVAYLAGFLLHAVAILQLPLYLAQAAISLSMPVTALVARLTLHERLGLARWVAVAAVTVALALLAVGSGDPGRIHPTGLYAAVLWLGIGVILVAGLKARHWSGAWLGALAGVAYTGSATAVRGLDTPVTALVLLIALSVPVLGVLAFWIYSSALDRAAVTASTGPLIVVQTFLPAVLGVAALGDGVRSWPAAVVGLVLATGATVALSREG
jgi:drug/metabolite transporter (DMT)-like permease